MGNKYAKGRPPVDKPSNKSLAGVRVTEEQINNYKKAAERDKKTLSDWVRGILDRAAKRK